jgi:adenosylhomocysteine nucleosidase
MLLINFYGDGKMVGIIGAMDIEVKDLLVHMEYKSCEEISGIKYYTGRINGTLCAVAQCGIGKVAAAVCAQTMILKYKPEALVNVGVAGGVGSSVHIGDIVVSDCAVQHDMDTTALGDPAGMISGINLVKIPASERLVKLACAKAEKIYGSGKVHIGTVATGDQFISGAEKLKGISSAFGASACEMEGGSIAQVCYINNVDFVILRAISDKADEKADMDFNSFAEKSAKETAGLITDMLPGME